MENVKTPWKEMPSLTILGTDYSVDIRAGKLWALTTGVDDVQLAELEIIEGGCYFGYFDAAQECFVSLTELTPFEERMLYAVIIPSDRHLDFRTYEKMNGRVYASQIPPGQTNVSYAFTLPVTKMEIIDFYNQSRIGQSFSLSEKSVKPFEVEQNKKGRAVKKKRLIKLKRRA